MHVDPLPDYLNQGFHPFQFDPDSTGVHPDYDPVRVPRYITLIVDRMFDPANAITLEHVLSLSTTRRSPLFRGSELRFIPDDTNLDDAIVERLPDDPAELSNSKGWGISTSATNGPVVTLQDGHTNRDTLTQRP